MGVSVSVYVGPFVRINLVPTTYDVSFNSCSNEQCSRHGAGNNEAFCSKCGSSIELMTSSRVGCRGWNDFLESVDYECEDDLYMPEYLGTNDEQVLLSNYNGNHLDGDGAVLSMSDENNNFATKMTAFHDKHGELLRKMKEFFGNNVTVDYGVCSFWQ